MSDEKKPVICDVQRVIDSPIAEVLVFSETMRMGTLSPKTKDYLSTFEEKAKEPPLGAEKYVVVKSRQDFLDEMTLRHAHHDTPSKLPPSATPEQIAKERERRLNALTTRHRVVFSQWPRDPDTKEFIKPDNSLVGKTAGNGLQLWGATMFDFYAVLRHPSIPNLRTLSVGSKLLGWVKKVGEDYELARSNYEWAEREEDPKTLEPCDIEVLIREGEAEMRRCIDSGEIEAYEAKEREEWEAEQKEEKRREEVLAAFEKAYRKDLEQISKPQSNDVQEGERESKSESNNVEMKEAEGEEQNKQDTKSEVLDNGEENTMDKKLDEDDEKKRQAFPIPTDKMDGFSVMGEKLGDWEQEREPVKFDDMEITESAPEEGEAKMTSGSNDVEMKDEREQTLASESKDADEEEPETESKGIEAKKITLEAKDVQLPEDEESDFPENHEITYPIDSLFNKNCYPTGWVRDPFTPKLDKRPLAKPQSLQKYIPQWFLPKKLVVHDPWNLLDATRWRSDTYKPWTRKEDITHVYNLQHSTTYAERRREDHAAAVKEYETLRNRRKAFLNDPHSKTERPNGFEMAVGEPQDDETIVMAYVVLPEIPFPVPVAEAHLYLSPAHAIGAGNHSFVYDAEFEVPRSFLVKEELCMDCVHSDVEEQLKERVEDLKHARPGRFITKTTVIPPYMMTCGPGDDETMYLLEEGSETTTTEYEGPYDVVIQSRVRYQNLERAPYCEHLKARETSIHPLTTKVSVAAKLSLEHDEHLRLEAYNYQRFPKHFFEHWSGYNIIRPFHQPVPLGAIVPQFYGYYKIDKASRGDHKEYMSPILLIEKCGTPIAFDELSIDDKQECASLLYRLHEAAWTQGSVYERNILRQPGPITAFPAERELNKAKRGGYGENWSYRMIDFGRAEYVGDQDKRQAQDTVRLDAWKMDKWANGFQDTFG